MNREDRVYEEAVALWRQLYRDPPPADACGAEILGMIVGGLADADYNRLKTPHLRPNTVTFPK